MKHSEYENTVKTYYTPNHASTIKIQTYLFVLKKKLQTKNLCAVSKVLMSNAILMRFSFTSKSDAYQSGQKKARVFD